MKKIYKIALFVFVFVFTTGYVATQISGYSINNREVGKPLQATFKYEKKIDLTNGDRTKVPNADFSFTASGVNDNSAYMIGKKYASPNGQTAFEILKGNVGGASLPFSTVKFRETDRYDAVLTSLMDSYGSADAIINQTIKYDWGTMRSSERIQTTVVRQANAEELKVHRSGNGNGWPSDTAAYRCFHEQSEGSYEDGCQSLLKYDFDRFDYVSTFDLGSNPAVTYFAYSYGRELLSHVTKGNDGNYNTVSKPLIKPEGYDAFVEKLATLNNDQTAGKVYRYLLKETAVSENFEPNTEEKVMDYLPGISRHPNGEQGILLIFNSVSEADAFYQEAREYRNNDNGIIWEGSYFTDLVPSATFTNKYKKASTPQEETPKVTPEKETPKPQVDAPKPNKPENGKTINESGKNSKPSIENAENTKNQLKKPLNTSSNNVTMTFIVACISILGILVIRKNTK